MPFSLIFLFLVILGGLFFGLGVFTLYNGHAREHRENERNQRIS